ncbi:MAG: hypothetical protein QFB87_05420 [Patescibacteria group bacterium]|nr:hypothetical protein [Patescibacteria group bacterium]
MAKTTKTTSSKPKSAARSKKTSQTKVYDSGSPLLRFLIKKPVIILFILLFAGLGTWLIAGGHALNLNDAEETKDNPARGLIYNGKKEASSGHCKGAFETDTTDASGQVLCGHPDPGPEGVDVRERNKGVDAQLNAQAAKDAKTPALAAEADTVSVDGAADVGSANSLNAVTPVNWPCAGTGTDGYRLQMIYAYAGGAANRVAYVRPGFETIARRLNAVYHNSGVVSGAVRNVRFVTDGACTLSLPAVAITGDINDANNIRNQLRARGFNASSRKYLVEVDGGSACGWGDLAIDSKPTQDNANNSGNLFAFVWHPCWNYAEPHETMHTMGAVQIGAPYGTSKYHCYDQHDVMCYNDGSGKAMILRCTNSIQIWRFDCGSDTYFRAVGASGWLSTHWNTANSRFLSH